MNGFSAALGVFSLLFGLGIVYLSRFLLRNYPKLTGSELESLSSELEGMHRTYRVLNTVTVLSVGFLCFLLYQLNRAFWEERVIVLFVPIFVVFTLVDGLFALRTKVFPTTTKYNWDNYVYDGDEELSWVAYWQIGLSMFLLVIDYVLFRSTL
jgi:hypothetical protein